MGWWTQERASPRGQKPLSVHSAQRQRHCTASGNGSGILHSIFTPLPSVDFTAALRVVQARRAVMGPELVSTAIPPRVGSGHRHRTAAVIVIQRLWA